MKLFPNQIPIFPLSGVIYFPKTNLPLNIFEQRYLNLVDDVVKKDKFMGMVQSKKENKEVYKVGCLGKINNFQKNEDGRVLINLTGVARFEIKEEITNFKLYREFKVEYKKFESDIDQFKEQINESSLIEKSKIFFKKYGLLLNWIEFEKLDKVQRVNTLAMIAPVTNEEKQKVLEAVLLSEKVKTLENIISFYLHDVNFNNTTIQ